MKNKSKLQGIKKQIYLVNERKPKQNTELLTKPAKNEWRQMQDC